MTAAGYRRACAKMFQVDRLARSARFLLSVVEGSSDGGVIFCDLSQVPAGSAGKFLVTQMAAAAEWRREAGQLQRV